MYAYTILHILYYMFVMQGVFVIPAQLRGCAQGAPDTVLLRAV